jgi:valyl-tRNA synthetase
MEEMRDWPISRQIVWGIRIPIWYDVDENPDIQVTFLDAGGNRVVGRIGDLLGKYSFDEIKAGLQSLIAPKDANFQAVPGAGHGPEKRLLQETDTFDTWFSSGHWPLATLRYPDSEDFKYFYPTSVMETGWEIIRFWVSRMIMFGIYLTGKPPFKDVYLHGLVRALDGKKMSKSLGNVIDPLDYIEEYGADALRMGLISGTANGRDFAFPKDKVIAYRNFANKLWNMARFILMMMGDYDNGTDFSFDEKNVDALGDLDKLMLEKMKKLTVGVTASLERYRFADSAEMIYQFMWHEVADKYIEYVKGLDGEQKIASLSVLRYVFVKGLVLLHPFMPLVTEAIWGNLPKFDGESDLLIREKWPE